MPRRSSEDQTDSSESSPSSDNPFVLFRRAIDSHVTSIFRNVFPSQGFEDEPKDMIEAFEKLQERWDRLAERKRQEAARFYLPEAERDSPSLNSSRGRTKQSASKMQEPQADTQARGHQSLLGGQWLGYDGRKQRDAQKARHAGQASPEQPTTTFESDKPFRASGALTEKFAALKPIRTNPLRLNLWIFDGRRNHAYPDYDLPKDTIDDPFINLPGAVPWLLHNRYSPLNISSTSFDGTPLRWLPGEKEDMPEIEHKHALESIPFKEAFEDLMLLQTRGEMVSQSKNYASSRNFSGHPMHWITRLIEAGSLGRDWSVWGNGGTRIGLWFFNKKSNFSINATLHSRLAAMPHIPYQGYHMQWTWLQAPTMSGSRCAQVDTDLHAAVNMFNEAADMNTTAWSTSRQGENASHQRDMVQASANHFQLALNQMSRFRWQYDDLTKFLIELKINELCDRSIHLSEYLTSKRLGLRNFWWYRSETDYMFEEGFCWKGNFANTPFLASVYDDIRLLGLELNALDTGLKQSPEETFVDLNRIKKLTELAMFAHNDHIEHIGIAPETISVQHVLDVIHRWTRSNIAMLKSRFIEEGDWDHLCQYWHPEQTSDYYRKDVETIREDCFKRDIGDEPLLPSSDQPSFSLNNRQYAPIYSPECPSDSLSNALFLKFLGNLAEFSEYTAACCALARENYQANFLTREAFEGPPPVILKDQDITVWGENNTNLFTDRSAWQSALRSFKQRVLEGQDGDMLASMPSEKQQHETTVRSFLYGMRQDGFFAESDKYVDSVEAEMLRLQNSLSEDALHPNAQSEQAPLRDQMSPNAFSDPFQGGKTGLDLEDHLLGNILQSLQALQTRYSSHKPISENVREAGEAISELLMSVQAEAEDASRRISENPDIAKNISEMISASERLANKIPGDPYYESHVADALDHLDSITKNPDFQRSSSSVSKSKSTTDLGDGWKKTTKAVRRTFSDGSEENKIRHTLFNPEGVKELEVSDDDEALIFEFIQRRRFLDQQRKQREASVTQQPWSRSQDEDEMAVLQKADASNSQQGGRPNGKKEEKKGWFWT
ncbi:MAG: hypothetical protein Q9227_005320 [Pyrenula ochraceoflavens]